MAEDCRRRTVQAVAPMTLRAAMSYRLPCYTTIPASLVGGRYLVLDLWARDLEAQARVASHLRLLSPARDRSTGAGLAALPAGISVTAAPRSLDLTAARLLVRNADVVQVPWTQPLWRAPLARTILRAALAETAVDKLADVDAYERIARGMRSLALHNTIGGMHAARAAWIRGLIDSKR